MGLRLTKYWRSCGLCLVKIAQSVLFQGKFPEVNISTTEDRCHNADRMQVPSFYYGALKSAKPKITIGTVRARFVSHFL